MHSKSRLLRALDAFGAVTALLLVATWLYGLQLRNWMRARQLQKSHPALALVPHPLRDTSIASDPGITLAEFGYRFDVPWTQIQAHETAAVTALYRFPGGFGLTVWNATELTTTIKMMREAAARNKHPFTNFLGARTEYELLNSELQATPGQLSPFMPRLEAYRRSMLLSLKQMDLPGEATADLYSFAWKGWRGFQLGDPEQNRVVEVRCFDANDREVRFFFAVERGSNTNISQPDINKVVQSLRPAEKPLRESSRARR
jgi:hypothetical protein